LGDDEAALEKKRDKDGHESDGELDDDGQTVRVVLQVRHSDSFDLTTPRTAVGNHYWEADDDTPYRDDEGEGMADQAGVILG
jgi:hypothetical protein